MKIAVVCPDAFTAWHFHRPWLLALREQGLEVAVISPPVHAPDVAALAEAGITHIPVTFDRFISPVSDLKYLARLFRIFRQHRFTCVHSLNVKCFIYGSLAAFAARVPRVLGTLEGLGFAYTDPVGMRGHLLVRAVDVLARLACAANERVWFLNADDLDSFVSRGLIPRQKAVLIRSAGVNIREFSTESVDAQKVAALRTELHLSESTSVVTMLAARAVWSKGVREFVDACERLTEQYPGARFVLLAPLEPNSLQAVPSDYLLAAESRMPNFRWLSGFRSDVREILAVSDIVTLPSYYREGVPRVLLEAMAMGKPIVTTDNVGCRETVDDGQNGSLVPVRDARALAAAIGRLLAEPATRAAYGLRSRQKVTQEFAEGLVVRRVLQELYAFEPRAEVGHQTYSRDWGGI